MGRSVAIVGGGISGLSLAYYLKRSEPECDIQLFESAPRLGGVMESSSQRGFLFEKGPRTFPYARADELYQLIVDLGLEGEVIDSDETAAIRYLCHEGRLEPLPQSFFALVRSPLTKGLAGAIIRDMLAGRGAADETIRSFFERRIGKRLTEQLIDPMVSGIYAGDIGELSIRSTFGFLKRLEEKERSLILGMIKGKKKKKKGGLFTLKGGLNTLINALAEQTEMTVHLNTPVAAIEENRVIAAGENRAFDHIYLTVDADQVRSLLPKRLAPYMEHVRVQPLSVVNVGYREACLKTPGFGALAPSKEKEPFLGILFDSSIFPQQNQNQGEKRFTVMIQGIHGQEELRAIALDAIERYLDIGLKPDYVGFERYEKGICQCLPGHEANMEGLAKELEGSPLSVHATFFHGPSVNACVKASSLACI